MRTHGIASSYTSGCRCDPCRWAWANYQRGDRPAEPIPSWFDAWVGSAGAL